MMTEKMVNCDDCANTGFIDKVRRDFWTMEPKEKICSICNGRGWIAAPQRNWLARLLHHYHRMKGFG